jgi:eukaryotic-like serine/threonine-protein kinase
VDDELLNDAASVLGIDVVRDLRSGGQKTVRLVRRDSEELVMKVIALDSGAPDALRRAQREVELLQNVSDAHVVKVASDLAELGEPVRGAAWLEQYLEGEDLSDLVGPEWPWDDVAAMALDVACGLGALHAVKVVHRDLSANNVRRLGSGQYVVMDPGFARHTLLSDLTVGGQPGTPGFLSPEHLFAYSAVPTAASDVFCVGILMFLTLSGHLPIPFTGDAADYISRLARVETLDLVSFRTDLPPDVVDLVRRCMHPQPARRFRNGNRLREALEALR